MDMQRQQMLFQQLAAAHRKDIMQLRRERNQAGLMALQEQLARETAEQAKALPPVLTDEQVQVYTAVGGTPHLDGQYTVFGEVVSGLDIVEQIQQTETLRGDRPKTDVVITSAEVV